MLGCAGTPGTNCNRVVHNGNIGGPSEHPSTTSTTSVTTTSATASTHDQIINKESLA